MKATSPAAGAAHAAFEHRECLLDTELTWTYLSRTYLQKSLCVPCSPSDEGRLNTVTRFSGEIQSNQQTPY